MPPTQTSTKNTYFVDQAIHLAAHETDSSKFNEFFRWIADNAIHTARLPDCPPFHDGHLGGREGCCSAVYITFADGSDASIMAVRDMKYVVVQLGRGASAQTAGDMEFAAWRLLYPREELNTAYYDLSTLLLKWSKS